MDILSKTGQNVKSVFDNQTFTLVVSLILALYAGLAAPALPKSVILFFDTIVGKLVFLFLIAYVASRNIQIALMIALGFLITLYFANKIDKETVIQENFMIDLNLFGKKTKPTKKTIRDDLRKTLCEIHEWALESESKKLKTKEEKNALNSKINSMTPIELITKFLNRAEPTNTMGKLMKLCKKTPTKKMDEEDDLNLFSEIKTEEETVEEDAEEFKNPPLYKIESYSNPLENYAAY